MLFPRSIFLAVVALVAPALARSSTGDRVLVVLESGIAKTDYSKFWASLEDRGFDLTFAGPKDDKTELTKYGEAQYDHLILYAPSTKAVSRHLSPKAIIDAQIAGLNTLYLLSSSISETQRETLREYDIEFTEAGTLLLDAFSHPASSTPSTVLLAPTSCLISNGPLLSNSTLSGGPIVFPSSAVHTLGQNPYLVEIAHAPKTAFVGDAAQLSTSSDESEVEAAVGGKTRKGPIQAGRKATLVSALQTRDNVRIGFVGSGAAFSDEFWGKKVKTVEGQSLETGNAAFANDLTSWLFQETGVVKVVSSTHHRDDETEPRDQYTKKDPVTYNIELAQYNPIGSSWGPVYLPDLQLEFTMLDPHIRTALKQVSASSTGTSYSASFMAPDRHGVFKFVVEYWRPGWTYIRSSTKASVVPLRHDQHPRWVSGAWPFYTSTVSISASFLLFCGLWIALGEGDRKGKKKAE